VRFSWTEIVFDINIQNCIKLKRIKEEVQEGTESFWTLKWMKIYFFFVYITIFSISVKINSL